MESDSRLRDEPVIMLAGGRSSRLGEPKGLVLGASGQRWIDVQIAKLAATGFREIVVALGYDLDAYRSALPWLERALGADGAVLDGGDVAGVKNVRIRVRCAMNASPELGPFSSFIAAAKKLESPPASWILPVDVPCPLASTWSTLATSDADACVPTYQDRGGHPVRISGSFLRTLLELPLDGPDSRLDVQIRLLGPRAERIAVDDPAVVENRNFPKDWK